MNRIPYNPKEAEVIRYIPSMRPWMPPTPVFSPVVPPRENFLAFLRNEKPLWMPSVWDYRRFVPRIIPDNVAKGMVADSRPFDPAKEGGGKDWFGIPWQFDPVANGALVNPDAHPVEDINDWESYVTLPDPDSPDWKSYAAENYDQLHNGYLIQIPIFSGLFERLMSFMGMTEAMVAMIDEDQKPGVHRLFDYLCGFYDRLLWHYKYDLDCDLVWFHDDWGSERAPMCSPDTYREMVQPYLKRIVESCHNYGMFFEFHCCGKNEMLVPIMIECGVDMWTPQPMNDLKKMYELYGDKIKFGVYPPGRTPAAGLPPMTDEETGAAVDEILETFSRGNVWMGMYMGASPHAAVVLYEKTRKAYDRQVS